MTKTSIYFDNAASTPTSPEVLAAMMPYLTTHFGNASSIHQEGRIAKTAIENARKQVAKILNASIGEIFFTSGGTESNNTAIKCAVSSLGVQRIITCLTEHPCVLNSIVAIQKKYPVEVVYLKVDQLGRIDYHLLETTLASSDAKTLVSLMHGNNEIGTMIDLQKISDICLAHQAYFHTDAVQTVGHYKIDLQALKIHFLAASAHKLHGPKGIGLLYINSELSIEPFIDGGGQERNMRSGTENVANIVGMAKALELYDSERDVRADEILILKTYFKQQLDQELVGIEFNGDVYGDSLYTVLSVSFPHNEKSDMLLMLLDIEGVCISGGSACSSGAEHKSHVIEALGKDENRKTIRFSLSHYNTVEEVDTVIQLLKKYF